MGKVITREFLGERWIVLLLWFTVIGIPIALIYVMEMTVTVEEEMEKPGEFVERYKRSRGR